MYIHPYILAIPLANLLLTSTNTTITMTWTLPSFIIQTYKGFNQCRRLCEQTLGLTIHTNLSTSSPYTFTGIDPGTYCIVGLNGIYDSDQYFLGTEITTTLSSGNYVIFSYSQLIYFSLVIHSTHFICQ